MSGKTVAYYAFVHKEPGTSFGVSFPDFPGCITAGDTPDEALRRAPETLSFHIRGMIEDKDEIPEPSDLEAVLSHEDAKGAAMVLVTVKIPSRKGRQVNIPLEEALLEEIDSYACRHDMKRSALLAVAARRYLRSGAERRTAHPAARKVRLRSERSH